MKKDPNYIIDSGLAGVLGAAMRGKSQDMHDALQKMLAEARAAMPDDPEFQAQMDKVATQRAELIEKQDEMEKALASGDPVRIEAARRAIEPAPEGNMPPEVEALYDAIEEGSLAAVRKALPGVDLNRGYGTYSIPPILRALHAETNRLEMVTALLDAGARADFATEEGYTPLHWVADAGYSHRPVQGEIARLLVARGGDIAARNHYGWTPLHAAVLEGSTEELAALLAVEADPNLRYTQESMPYFTRGQTPLMVAKFDPDKVALLLEHGADPRLTSDSGESLIDHVGAAITDQAKSKGLFLKLFSKLSRGPDQRVKLLASRELILKRLES